MININAWKDEYLSLTLNNDVKLFDELSEFIPETIYKYVSLSSVEDDSLDNEKINTLKNNQLYLATPGRFNDPYDCQLNMDISKELHKVTNLLIEKELNKVAQNRAEKRSLKNKKDILYKEVNVKAEIQKLTQDLKNDWNNFKKEISVCCLSQRNDSMLMWSHYANAYNGFCIEYKFDKVVECLKKQKCNIFPVRYSDELQSLSIFMKKSKMELAGIYATMSKAKVWEYENEWRILGNIGMDYVNGRLISMPKPMKLYLGCNLSEDKKNILLKFAKEERIEIVNVKLNTKKYELIVK